MSKGDNREIYNKIFDRASETKIEREVKILCNKYSHGLGLLTTSVQKPINSEY
jgi:hypothetical protein